MLTINTAFLTANLALKTKDNQVILKEIDAKSKHSENVVKTIDEMCQEAKIDILDVDTIAVVTGPGSFTGLRIGTAIAKALGCVNKNLKFISLSSLQLMAYTLTRHRNIEDNFVCAINALSNLFFVCEFDKNGIKIGQESMIDKEKFDKITENICVLKGDISKNDFEIELNCQDLLDFALKKQQENNFISIEDLQPIYIRKSQAEDMLQKKTKI